MTLLKLFSVFMPLSDFVAAKRDHGYRLHMHVWGTLGSGEGRTSRKVGRGALGGAGKAFSLGKSFLFNTKRLFKRLLLNREGTNILYTAVHSGLQCIHFRISI